MKKKDWTNKTINFITFIRPLNERRNNKIIWEAQCICGNKINIVPSTVISGNNISCGCYREQKQKEISAKAGAKSRKYSP
jgi:hypothetical protein